MELFTTTVTEQAKKNVNDVLDSGFLNQGKYVDLFEEKLKGFGLANPLTLNSCTSALHLALLLSGVDVGDEVILPPQTFISTGLAILMCRGTPIFADVDVNGNLDPEDLKKKITYKTKAVMVVHWGGTPAQMTEIHNICRAKGLWLIEDAAHALGAWNEGRNIGSCGLSDFCCFSLQSIKSLTSGDGGILCLNDCHYNLIEKARLMRWFGMDKKNVVRNENGEREVNVEMLGFKAHMNDYTASLALGNCEGLNERLMKRRAIAQLYNDCLKNVEKIHKFGKAESSYWLYTIRVKNRVSFIKKLKAKGIPASTVDTRIDKNKIFGGPFDLPGQAQFEATQISIPCHHKLTLDDILLIINTINEGW